MKFVQAALASFLIGIVIGKENPSISAPTTPTTPALADAITIAAVADASTTAAVADAITIAAVADATTTAAVAVTSPSGSDSKQISKVIFLIAVFSVVTFI